MHIALYSPAWPPEEFPNGIVTYVHWMRQELLGRGHRVSVLAGMTAKGGEWPGVYGVDAAFSSRAWQWTRRRLGMEKDALFSWGARLAACAGRIHRRHSIDVLEMEESFGWVSALIADHRFPVVVKLHGPAFLSLVEEQLQGDLARKKIEAEGSALKSARAITSPSRCTLSDTLLRYGLHPAIQAHVVNPLALDSGTRLWSAASSSRTTLLFVGRFDKRKGGDRVLMAFKKLLQARQDLNLVFVGPDAGLTSEGGKLIHFDDFCKSLFSSSQRCRINYLGSRPQADIARLRSEAAVTIVASRWESQGYTALEAMLQGCPVVCADTSGLSESVVHGETGLLFQGDDIDAMVDRIRFMLNHPESAERLGRAARAYVLATHGVAHVLDQTLGVYESAIGDFTGRGRLPGEQSHAR